MGLCYLFKGLQTEKVLFERILFMKRSRTITTTTCCNRALSAFNSICSNIKDHGTADETNFSFKLRRLTRIISKSRDYNTMRIVSETMCEIFSLILENNSVANFFYEDNFIMDFSTRFRNLDVPYKYREAFSEKLNNFIKKSGNNDANIDMIFSIAANAGIFCDDVEMCRLRMEFYRNLHKLNSASIYFAIINNVIDMDRKIIYRLKSLCKSVEGSSLAETASVKNPVYVLLNLFQHKCIKSIREFDEILYDNNMYIMVTRTSQFNAENFKPQWWKLLTDPYLQEKLGRRCKNVELIIDKMEEYRSRCFGNNIIFYDDVIDSLNYYGRIAR